MGYKNREIELKLEVKAPLSLAYLKNQLFDWFGEQCIQIISGHSKDVYFKAPKNARADFVRVRYGTKDEESQLTLKFSDRKHNKNRIEYDLPIDDPNKASEMLVYCFGKPVGEIKKRYHVFFFGKHDNISIYQVDGDKRVFVEIEATTHKKVQKLLRMLKQHLHVEMQPVHKSLYQLFLVS